MKQLLYGVICLFEFTACYAQPVRYPFSQIYQQIGVYGKSADAFSPAANAASLAKIKASSGGVYAETPYMLKELSIYSAAWVVPLKTGALGFSGNFSGNADLHYNRLGIAYGKRLSPVLCLGAQISFSNSGITGYGSSQTLTAGIGAILTITDKVVAGVRISNIGTGSFGRRADKAPAATYNMGIGYETSDCFLLQFQISKEEDLPVILVPAIQYNIKKEIFARVALISETGTLVAGTGFQWKNIRTDVSASYHPHLGFTPGLLILFKPL